MNVDDIPDAMVEAAANEYGDALMMSRYTQPGDENDPDAPEDFDEHNRGEDLKVMRAVLAAALSVCTASKVWTDPRPGHGDYHWMFYTPVIPRDPQP